MNKKKLLYNIGKLSSNARKREQYTQKDVANVLHTSQQEISEYERGKNNNAITFIYYLTNYFNPADFHKLLFSMREYITGEKDNENI